MLNKVNKYKFQGRLIEIKDQHRLYGMDDTLAVGAITKLFQKRVNIVAVSYGETHHNAKNYNPPLCTSILREFGNMEPVDEYKQDDLSLYGREQKEDTLYELYIPEIGITYVVMTYSNTSDDRGCGRGAGRYTTWYLTEPQARLIKSLTYQGKRRTKSQKRDDALESVLNEEEIIPGRIVFDNGMMIFRKAYEGN